MADSLAKRMTDNQIRMASDDLIRDADRLAEAARQYASDAKGGKPESGGAHRLAQTAADLLRQAARLDGMRDIAGLVAEED